MGLVLTDFRGTLPGVANYDLPSNAASEAIDCEFGGTVRAARFHGASGGGYSWPVKVYDNWLQSDTPNGILPSPMAQDATRRVYWVQGGRLVKSLGGTTSNPTPVGVAAPTSTLNITPEYSRSTRPIGSPTAEPVGEMTKLDFALAYFGNKSGVWYTSQASLSSVSAYDNSYVVFDLSPSWYTDLMALREQARTVGEWGEQANAIQIGLFFYRDGDWRLVADTSVMPPDKNTALVSVSAPSKGGFFETGAEMTFVPSPAMPSSVEAILPNADGSAPTVSSFTPTDIEVGEMRSYIFTRSKVIQSDPLVYEESAPSQPVVVGPFYSSTKAVIHFPAVAAADEFFTVYRAANGLYLRVLATNESNTMNATSGGVYDAVPNSALGEECSSMDWLPPPSALDGVVSTGVGFFVAWKDNSVYASELYLPHAWPAGYTYTTRYKIRRCVPAHNGIFAISDNGNYFITGQTPTGLSIIELPTFHPCIGDMTAVDMGDGVVYAAPNGLALVTTSGSQLLTEGAIDPTWWAAQNFTNAVAYRAGESYVLTVGGQTLVFNLRNKTIHKATGLPPKATFDQATGNLQTSSGSISASSFAPSYVWQSKIFEFNRMPTFGFTQCIATAYPVSVRWKLWKKLADGTADAVEQLVTYNDHHPKRFIPGAFHRVQARIESSNPVSKVVLTNNREELEYVG